MNDISFPLLLRTAAALQFGLAILNLFLVRFMKWRADLSRAPLLLREVFQVHSWFISVTLSIFALLTWRFLAGPATAANSLHRWLAGSIGFFWLLRTGLQMLYYSSSHWRGQPGRTLIHVLLLGIYGGFSFVYLTAAFCQPTGGTL